MVVTVTLQQDVIQKVMMVLQIMLLWKQIMGVAEQNRLY